MKLSLIDIRNVIGARAIELQLDTPIILFAGANGSGKSSTLEAVRMALGEDPQRVALKKEYRALVTDGAKSGRVNVVADGETHGITFPDGKRYGPVNADIRYLPYVLEPGRFAAQEGDARRTMLFSLTGCQAAGQAVADMLAKRGCNARKIDTILPKLDAGFPAAADFAKEQARQAKADWKAITNEAWGDKKAAEWKAAVPEFDACKLKRVADQIDALDEQISAETQNLGRLQEQHKQYRNWLQGDADRKEQIRRLPSLRTKLEHDEKDLQRWTEQVQNLEQRAGSGPRVGLVHELAFAVSHLLAFVAPDPTEDDARAEAALAAYEHQYGPLGGQADPEAQALLPEAIKARDLMARAVENTRRDIAVAEHASSQVESLDIPAVGDEEIAAAEGKVHGMRREREQLDAERAALDRTAEAAKAAAINTATAAQRNADVCQWLALADALSPDGIPGEILSAALKPINDRLRRSADATGWRQASIGADMIITANGRPYPLLSESEKWRTDAMLAEAVSYLSGLKLLILDRVDVLEPAARPELLGWLDMLAADGDIGTVLIGITLKARPTGLPDTMAAHWLDQGQLILELEPA